MRQCYDTYLSVNTIESHETLCGSYITQNTESRVFGRPRVIVLTVLKDSPPATLVKPIVKQAKEDVLVPYAPHRLVKAPDDSNSKSNQNPVLFIH